MTPEAFIEKWRDSGRGERQASQSHFNDLCALLGETNPTDADHAGEWFCFEKGAKKTGGGDGWADVWKKGHFGWEYKGPNKDLDKAYQQLQRYAVALENPPLLVVSDTRDIIIHTHFTNAVYQTHSILLEDIGTAENLQKLKWLFTDPERLRPGQTRDAVTAEVAKAFAGIAQRLRDQLCNAPDKIAPQATDGLPFSEHGQDHALAHVSEGEAGMLRPISPQTVAHFVNRLLFCMFAEDIELLPDRLFTRLLEACEHDPQRFAPMAGELFAKMNKGGYFGADEIAWFNGGLFDDDTALPLDAEGVKQTLQAARMDWSSIEPSIFGIMFERGLDPAKRSQLGAHYTDAQKIMLIIEPVILRPLRREWDTVKTDIEAALRKAEHAKSKAARSKGMNKVQSLLGAFLDRLRNVRILDPACGSGNFLYLALMHVKDLEHRVLLEAESMGLGMQLPQLGPEIVKGIEINPYAAELARVTVWIGQIQWMISHGFSANRTPILESLETIENRDALINANATEAGFSEANWPEAEFIIGNPPFLGGSKILRELGEEYTKVLRNIYDNRVPGSADLVTYWFAKAHEAIKSGKSSRTGLVATNSIRGGANREVLDDVVQEIPIFEAWSDEPWVVDGAAVRVSLVSFGNGSDAPCLDGTVVPRINSDLTGQLFDSSQALCLKNNRLVSFQGSQKIGPFDIPGDLAREFLKMPTNPNNRPNSNVIRPSWNGLDVTRRPRDVWMIDFGCDMSEAEAALYETPFEYVAEYVKPVRLKNNREAYRKYWWRHGEPRVAMRETLKGLNHYIVTPHVAKHRIFCRLPTSILPDKMLIVIARDDDAIFGILHSRLHELWSLRMGTSLEDRPRYTPTTCFETFPFPKGFPLQPDSPFSIEDFDDIGEIAKRLDELRNNWLNPPEWVERVAEVVEGFPDRIIAKPGHEADLKKRTLTNLYNARPAWLDNIHKQLDTCVAAAYGWDDYTADMPDEEILARLFALNQQRSSE
ncbi:MAG: class I SAM-dependent DNA methyltransferase [Mariprofundaceae bacterium]|nr:class I SAM-dependent DNA methyltransferase [Mariprofundaceae bacterium]